MLDEYDLNNCNEADTCRKLITPRLIKAGWDDEPHSFTEQKTFTDGRIVVVEINQSGDRKKGPTIYCATLVTLLSLW